MRIAVDLRLADALKTGSAHYACGLVRALAEHDTHNQYLLLTASGSAGRRLVDQPNVLDVRSPDATLLNPTWEQVRLPGLLDTHRADVLLSLTLVLPLAARTPSVMVLYDVGFELFPEFYSPELRDYLRRWVPPSVAKADAVVAISQSTKRDAVAQYADRADSERGLSSSLRTVARLDTKIHVVYPAAAPSFKPVEDAAALDAVAAKYGFAGPYALTVCSLEKNKNLGAAMAAFAELKARRPDVALQLAVVGRPGQDLPRIRRMMADLGIEPDVVLTGYVEDDDLPALYSHALMFLFPSLYEGFGLPPLEAMSCGAPVVASNRASLPEVLGDAALLVDPDDSQAMANAMQRLVEEPELRSRLRAAGLERAKRFSWPAAAQQVLRLLEHAAGRPSRAAPRGRGGPVIPEDNPCQINRTPS